MRKTFEQKTSDRYTRVVKQQLNRIYGSKSAMHQDIARIITAFSHKTILRPGHYMLCRNLHFFIVKQILSNHWVTGFFCPSQLHMENGIFYYLPNIWQRSLTKRKKIFKPFSGTPHVKIRKNSFYLQRKKHEPMSTLRELLNELY